MNKSYKENPDFLSILERAKSGEEKAINQIIDWYRFSIKNLAGRLISSYRHATYAEFDDLYSIGVESVYIAILKYSDYKTSFHSYWYQIASRKMMEQVLNCLDDMRGNSSLAICDESSDYLIGSGDVANYFMLEEDVDKFLHDPKNKLSPYDIELFYMYVDGYELKELAAIYDTSYQNVKNKIERICKKLQHIFS